MTQKQFLTGLVLAAMVFAAAFTGAVLGVYRAAQIVMPGQPAAQPIAPTTPATPKQGNDATGTTGGSGGGQGAARKTQSAGDADLPPLVLGLDESVFFGASGYKSAEDAILPLDFRTGVQPRFIRIGPDHPSGTRFTVHFDKVGLPLPVDFSLLQSVAFDEVGSLVADKGYYIQAGEHDFDSDGEPEIVVAVGNGLTSLVVSVIKYHPPASPADAGRFENWELLGAFDGQEHARVDEASLSLPYGSQGLFVEQTLVKGNFVRTN